jgi:peptide deformylase
MPRAFKNLDKINHEYSLFKKGSECLQQKCNPVTFPLEPRIIDCIDEMKNTLRYVDGFWARKSLACAAPQVGFLDRLFIVCSKKNWYTENQYKTFNTFINPEIVKSSEEMCSAWEGCISNDQDIVLVERPMHVLVRFQTIDGVVDKTTENREPIFNEIYMRGLMCRIF